MRGTIYTLSLLFGVYLLLFVLIYYSHPSPLVKTTIFFSYLFILIVSTAAGIIKPALSYFRLSKVISLEESATLIGKHFEPIRDKLLNTLQLKALADLSPGQNQLILAGIDQKISELKPIPFSNAVRLNDNKKYISYFLIPLLLIVAVAVIAPAVFKEGSLSFVNYNKEILPKAPFEFILNKTEMTLTQGDDLPLELKLNGDPLPQDVYITEGLNTFKLDKKDNGTFTYLFKNLQKNKLFRFNAGGFESKEYLVTVKARPSVLNMQVSLVYPSYLKKKNEVISNAGDLLLPAGTRVNWTITTENAAELVFMLGKMTRTLKMQNDAASFMSMIKESTAYSVVPKNSFSMHPDSILHKIAVIADLAPVIDAVETADSLSSKARYFTGKISDDHGFTSLKFVYAIKESGIEKKKVETSIPIHPQQQEDAFFYFWNMKNMPIKPGQLVTYYLEVTDNDAINGPKHTRSTIKTYQAPSEQEMAKQLNTESSNLKQKMASAIKLAAEVEKESKKLGENLLDKKSLSFENKNEVTQLLDKQKKLEEAVREIQRDKKTNTNDQPENEPSKAELADKQKQIDNLFNKILDPKTKELLEKLQGLMEQNKKDQVQNELSKMTMDNKSLKNELDRMLELYKQLEFEQNLENKVNRLKSMTAEQQKLSTQTKEKKADIQTLKEQQQQLNEQFQTLKNELKQLEKKNEALEHPNNFQPMEKESQDIEKQQQESIEKMDGKQQNEAAKNQDKAAKAMQKMADQMDQANQKSAEMENNLNVEELRRLLQNLLQTSFDQEKIMLSLRKMASADPSYIKNVQEQRGIKDNMKTIADSLTSLGKRVPQIESTVNTEMQLINFNVNKSLENLGERRTGEAVKNQQYTMSSINNLALMLNEALEQLEKSKKNAKSGGKGKGKQSMQKLQQMQQQLNKNMQQAKQQMEKEGNQGKVPKGKMSESFARMAQQQQMIRESLQKINSEENKDGKGSLGDLNSLVKEMKLTESDLVNKRIAEETIKRQQNLETRLLDADKASRKQDEDGKRESKSGSDLPASYPKMLEQFKKNSITEKEFLQKLPPSLNYYYKNKVGEYFKSLNSPL